MRSVLIMLLLASVALTGCILEPRGGYGYGYGYGNRGYDAHGWTDRNHQDRHDGQYQRDNRDHEREDRDH